MHLYANVDENIPCRLKVMIFCTNWTALYANVAQTLDEQSAVAESVSVLTVTVADIVDSGLLIRTAVARVMAI